MVLIASVMACRDEDAIRVPKFQNAPNFRMQLRPANSYFDFSNLASAKLIYDIYSENYDEIESVEISFRYQKNGAPSCANRGCQGPFVVKTYTNEQLRAAKGRIDGEEITIQSVLTLLGLSLSDITGGDQFFFVNKTTMTDGRVYPTTTIGANTNIPTIFNQTGASFTASFNAIVGCPLSAAFTGNFRVEQLEGAVNWNGGGNMFPTLASTSVTSVNPITRSFNVTYLGFTGRPMTIILLCGNVTVPNQSSGLACSGNSLQWNSAAPGVTVLGTYTPTSDASFDVHFMENPTLACGAGATYTRLRLTKV